VSLDLQNQQQIGKRECNDYRFHPSSFDCFEPDGPKVSIATTGVRHCNPENRPFILSSHPTEKYERSFVSIDG
jgi:hypothetical protein